MQPCGSVAGESTQASETAATQSEEGAEAPESYSVQGELLGLQGSALQLTLGDEILELDAEGSFAFETLLEDGAAVQLSVTQAPTGPEQNCTIEGNPGTVSQANAELVVRCITPVRHVVVLGIDGLGGSCGRVRRRHAWQSARRVGEQRHVVLHGAQRVGGPWRHWL